MRWMRALLMGAVLSALLLLAPLISGSGKLQAVELLSAPFSPTMAAPGGTVINPGAGLVHYPWGNPAVESQPYVSGRAGGPFWKDLEPSEGYFNWSVMENWLANLPPGRKTWLRLDASMRADQSLTPEWVFQAGARWVPFVVNSSVKVPVYWDPVFKAKWEAAIAALASRYDGDPRLAGVEVNGQGHYGEMVPEWERIFNGDRQTWVNAGYNDQLWIEHQKWAIDMFLRYFKKTPLAIQVVNDGALWGASPARPALDYAVQTYGMRVYPKWSGLGLNMRGMDTMFLDYVPYTDVIFEENLPFSGSAWEYGQVVDKAISARASVVYVYWSEFDPAQSGGVDYRPQLQRMAQYLGPQVFIAGSQVPPSTAVGQQVQVLIRWGNRGNLPLRAAQRVGDKDVAVSATAFVDLVAGDGTTAYHYDYVPGVPTTQWYPNGVAEDWVSLTVPASVPAGTYEVRAGVYNPRPYAAGARLKLLNTDLNDGSDRYRIGTLQVASSGAPPITVPTPTATSAPAPTTNLARGRPAVASSIENADLAAARAVDGDPGTRWSSNNSDPQWIHVDLGARYDLGRVVLNWETAYGRDYQIQVSDDATNWTTAFSRTGGTGGVETLAVSGSGRYVRMLGMARGAPWWGYSMWELEVYGRAAGSGGSTAPTPFATAAPATATPPPAATPPPPATSPAGSIAVDASRVARTVNPLWINGENVDQREWAYASGNYGDDVSSYKFGVVRIWDIPFWSSSADQVDQAVRRVKSAGLEPMVIIMNPKLADPGWAASRVQHFKDIGYPIKYFEFGNENDINDSSTPDGPFDGNAVGYSDAFNAAYDAMKAVDPSIKVGGPATAGLGDFYRTFLQRSGNRTDFVSYHNYAPWNDQDGQYGFRPLAQYARTLMNQYVTDNQYRSKGDVFLFLGEWDHANQNAPNAVYFLSAVYWQIKGGVDMAARYQHNDYWREEFNQPWAYSLYNPDGSRRSAFYFHQIIRDYVGDQVLESNSDDGQVLALGTRRSATGDAYLIVMNMKDLPVSKSISVAGVAPNATATIVLWNDQTYPPRELERRALQENGLTYEIPARSAVVFALSSSGSPAPPSQPTAASTPVPAPTSTPTPSPLPTATPPAPTATPTAVPALVNVAQGRPAVASSMESSSLGATLAVDGNGGTRWASRNSDPQWIYVDLGTTYNVSKVVLKWETAYGRDYQVQLSDDATNWRTIYNRQGGTGGTEALSVSGSGRYVRIFGTTRGVPWWGYSLWELEVYGKRPDLIARSGNFLVLMPLVLVR